MTIVKQMLFTYRFLGREASGTQDRLCHNAEVFPSLNHKSDKYRVKGISNGIMVPKKYFSLSFLFNETIFFNDLEKNH